MTNTITLTPHECFPVPCVSPRMYRKEVLSLCVFFFPRLPSRRRSSHARINDNNTVIHNATTDRINKQTRDHPTDTARERLRDVCYLRTTTRTGRLWLRLTRTCPSHRNVYRCTVALLPLVTHFDLWIYVGFLMRWASFCEHYLLTNAYCLYIWIYIHVYVDKYMHT